MPRAEHEPGKGAFWTIDAHYEHLFADGVYRRRQRLVPKPPTPQVRSPPNGDALSRSRSPGPVASAGAGSVAAGDRRGRSSDDSSLADGERKRFRTGTPVADRRPVAADHGAFNYAETDWQLDAAESDDRHELVSSDGSARD